MGDRARQKRGQQRRKLCWLTEEEKLVLLERACYEGSPLHKRNPGDFGLTPPASPRPDKTLCDIAEVLTLQKAKHLLESAIKKGVASESRQAQHFPTSLWVVDGEHVLEARYGGSRLGYYHGFPIPKDQALYELIRQWWSQE
jgi:hypothetical protein